MCQTTRPLEPLLWQILELTEHILKNVGDMRKNINWQDGLSGRFIKKRLCEYKSPKHKTKYTNINFSDSRRYYDVDFIAQNIV